MTLSILLATYNGAKYLPQQLDSLLTQTYSNFKIYISDDCSTDDTLKIIEDYVSKYPNKIIDIQNKQHFGNAQKNFLNLVEKVDSELYMFCDQDDVWLPEKVNKTIEAFNSVDNKNQPILVHSDLRVVDGDLQTINSSFFEMMKLKKNLTGWKDFVVQNYVTGCTMLANKKLIDLYKRNKHLINKENILMHDYFFALLASLMGKILFLDESLILYRQHGNNSVGAKNVNSLGYAIEKIRKSRKEENVNVKNQKQICEVVRLIEIENPSNKALPILRNYSDLYKRSKIRRIIFIHKNGLVKIGFKRKIFQLITI